jgi:hypothetical protein
MPLRVLDRETGEVLFVEEGEAQQGLLSGRYAVSQRQGSIGLTTSDNREARTDAAHLGSALRSGQLRLSTPEETQERELQREYGDSAGTAFGEGVLRELTFGASDYVIPEVASRFRLSEGLSEADRRIERIRVRAGARQAVRERRARNENAATFGEITGSIAPLLIPGGGALRPLSGVGRALRGATAIPRGSAMIGDAIASGVTRFVAGQTPGLGRRVLARGIGMGTGGAVEGSIAGVRQVLTEDALGEADLTAERVLAGGGLGALFGGGAGVLFGGGSALLGEGMRSAFRGGRQLLSQTGETLSRAWQSRTGRELRPGVAELVADGYARASSFVSGADQDTLRRFVDVGPEGRRVRELVRRGDEVLEEGTRRIRSDLTALEEVSAHVQDFARGRLKRQPIARTIRTDTINEQLQAAQNAIGRSQSLADDILANPHIYSGAGGVAQGRALATAVRGYGDDLANAMARAADDPAEASADIFIALDRMKRTIGQLQGRTRDPEAQRVLRDLYESEFRPLLENEAVWGAPVATMQRETNAAWTRYLTRRADFERQFLAEGERDVVDGFRRLSEGDPAKLRAFLGRVGSASNDRADETFREVLDAQSHLSDAVVKHFDVPEDLARSAGGARAGLDRIRRTLAEVTESAETLNQYRSLSSAGSVERAIIGGDIGTSIAGAPGALVAGALFNPGQAIRVLSVLDRMQQETSSKIVESVRGFLGRTVKSGREATARVGRGAGRIVRRAPAVTVRAYQDKIREINSATSDPKMLAQRLGEGTRSISGDAPRVQQNIQTTAVRAMQYLQSQIPPQNRAAHARLFPQREPRAPAHGEMVRFMRAVHAVEEPLSILDELAARRLRRASVDAVRAVYPRLYQQIVTEMTRELAASEREPSYQDRLALGILFGVPTDPSLRPAFIATIQASHAAQSGPPQQQPSAAPTREAPDVAGQLVSETQRIETRAT